MERVPRNRNRSNTNTPPKAVMSSPRHIFIGTSGWNYSHWKGPVYPESLSSSQWLPYLGERLPAVEINKSFLENLPEGQRFVFEFRDPTWFNEDAYSALEKYGAAFCIYELAGEQSPFVVTADFVYVRLHGPREAYKGSYSDKKLARWAGRFRNWRKKKKDVYCFFDNDEAGYAALNAQKLLSKMES